jgi:hypothetical protein
MTNKQPNTPKKKRGAPVKPLNKRKPYRPIPEGKERYTFNFDPNDVAKWTAFAKKDERTLTWLVNDTMNKLVGNK